MLRLTMKQIPQTLQLAEKNGGKIISYMEYTQLMTKGSYLIGKLVYNIGRRFATGDIGNREHNFV